MPCYHPLKAFYRIPEYSRKKDIVFASFGDFERGFAKRNNKIYPTPIEIPCGQCYGCRMDYARQWATRCVLEAQKYKNNFFVTLTYDPEFEHLLLNHNLRFDADTGEVVGEFDSLTLVPDHLTKFLKDLRRYFEYHLGHTGIRFFACGEYGSKKMRPHFHLVLFNCPIPDLKFVCTSHLGDSYFQSDILSKLWNKGFVTIADCNYSTCSYVARYMLKKQKGLNSNYYEDLGIKPPFTRSSRMPGIARDYYDENSGKIYEYDSLVITDSKGIAKKVRPPKYFDRLYDIDCPEDFDRIRKLRCEAAESSISQKLERTDLDKDSYLAVCEKNMIDKVKKLIRPID